MGAGGAPCAWLVPHPAAVHSRGTAGGQPYGSAAREGRPHLGKHVGVGVILQQHRGCPRIVVARRDVQGGQAHLPFRPIVDEVGHHVLVTLLQSHC